jgi:hypothetical protein
MIIEHGHWSLSASAEMKPGGQRVLHAQRDDTGMDWYVFVRMRPFGERSVVMTVGSMGTDELVVQAVTRDPTAIFPAGMLVIEETEYAGNDPFGYYHGHVYVPASRSIGAKFVPPPAPPTASEAAMLERIAALEAKLGLSNG